MITAPKKAEPLSKTVVPCREADHAITHRDIFQLCYHWTQRKASSRVNLHSTPVLIPEFTPPDNPALCEVLFEKEKRSK